ncbi:hypothetical protein DACRYDRAFT_101687 [Dacryopinax primogenitus]|uniref:Uncharacterized protein n=1 Tax=Dacryopinax primogenitus (strain DJM 731) TaxID=1858805 RepID=M5FPI1_DACPD|nr:uncharacterized protein DACRYDRAFT_101687 [Dacryopinax primogenitus]EJT98585.1 hypothetical protein DACRYDRAFT_101687 [Dacryopinax primogenitus]
MCGSWSPRRHSQCVAPGERMGAYGGTQGVPAPDPLASPSRLGSVLSRFSRNPAPSAPRRPASPPALISGAPATPLRLHSSPYVPRGGRPAAAGPAPRPMSSRMANSVNSGTKITSAQHMEWILTGGILGRDTSWTQAPLTHSPGVEQVFRPRPGDLRATPVAMRKPFEQPVMSSKKRWFPPIPDDDLKINGNIPNPNPGEFFIDVPEIEKEGIYALPYVRFKELQSDLDVTIQRPTTYGMVVGFPSLYRRGGHQYVPDDWNFPTFPVQQRPIEAPDNETDHWAQYDMLDTSTPVMTGCWRDGMDGTGMNVHQWKSIWKPESRKYSFMREYARQMLDFVTYLDRVLNARMTMTFLMPCHVGPTKQPPVMSIISRIAWADGPLMETFRRIEDIVNTRMATRIHDLLTNHTQTFQCRDPEYGITEEQATFIAEPLDLADPVTLDGPPRYWLYSAIPTTNLPAVPERLTAMVRHYFRTYDPAHLDCVEEASFEINQIWCFCRPSHWRGFIDDILSGREPTIDHSGGHIRPTTNRTGLTNLMAILCLMQVEEWERTGRVTEPWIPEQYEDNRPETRPTNTWPPPASQFHPQSGGHERRVSHASSSHGSAGHGQAAGPSRPTAHAPQAQAPSSYRPVSPNDMVQTPARPTRQLGTHGWQRSGEGVPFSPPHTPRRIEARPGIDNSAGVSSCSMPDQPSTSIWPDRERRRQENRIRHKHVKRRARDLSDMLDASIWKAAQEVGILSAAMCSEILGHQNIVRFRKQRAVNLKNVAVHLMRQEFWERGQHFDIQKDADAWKSRLDVLRADPGEEAVGCQLLEQHRSVHTNQVRITRKAREVDTTHTTLAIQNEVEAFYTRTGGHIVGFAIRGDRNDHALPQFFGNTVGESFFRQVFWKPVQEVAEDFDVYANLGVQGTIMGNNTVTMQYARFRSTVEDAFHVTLEGWPLRSFVNPSLLGVADLRVLKAALAEGRCHFRRLTLEELATRCIMTGFAFSPLFSGILTFILQPSEAVVMEGFRKEVAW